MASALFSPDDEKIISLYPIAKLVNLPFYRDSLPKGSFDQDIDEGVMDNFISLLGLLAAITPAKRIRLPDSSVNLRTRLIRFTSALSEQTTFPTTLRSSCSSLLEKIASPNVPDLDIWTAVAQLLVAFGSLRATPTFKESNDAVAISSAVVECLKNDWTRTFTGDSLKALQDVIQNFEHQPKENKDEFYARTLVFLQSSGMGKSRLADAFGQECPMINYVLREKGTLGFPPADDEILSFMREYPSNRQQETLTKSPQEIYPKKKTDMTWYHSLAVGLLQASFEILNTWVEKQPRAEMTRKDLAALRHKEMAFNSERIKFCKSVATRAEEIADNLIQKPTWRQVFDMDRGSAIRHELIGRRTHHLDDLLNATRKLTDNLRKFRSENMYDPPLVVVFDEASCLLKELGKQEEEISSGRYIALNRIMSCLKEYRIWFFIISTESQVGTIMPPDNTERTGDYVEDHSLRFAGEPRAPPESIPSFLAFRLDIEDQRRMQDPTQDELDKSLSDFGKPKHMAMFGRRLWHACGDDPEEMDRLAKMKLIGGVGPYQPHNQHHVFAALSFRLSLDSCLHNLKALPLIKTAINSHMRVVISIDQGTGTMVTLAPSEPILAKAAMEYLCSGLNWTISINTLVRELLEKGLVEKGLKGELYARLVITLAHDWVRCRQVSGEADGELHQNSNSGGGIHEESNSDFRPKFMKSFTVREFLETLYAEEGHRSIRKIDRKILEARMNFTHFALAEENLRAEILSELFVDLLRRGAALQLGPVQPVYDILIPIYFGKEDEALEPSKCSCIAIQVKNRDKKTSAVTPKALLHEKFTKVNKRKRKSSESPSTVARKDSEIASTKPMEEKTSESASTEAEKEGKAQLVLTQMKNPLLYLLFDFGRARTETSKAPSVEVSYSTNMDNVPHIWAIHSRGHDENVFRCLSLMDCVDAGKGFFISAVPGLSIADQIAKEHKRFSKLDRSFRLSAVKGTEKNETESEDEDMGI